MKKIYILFLVITSYACTAQILLNGRLIHELPAKSSVDTGDLIIVANPATGKPYKARKSQVVAGANGVTDGDKGDITVTGSGAIFTIDGSSVQNGKLALMGDNTFKGNLSGTTASPQDLTSGQVISALGINLKMAYTDTASLSNRINAKQNTLVSGTNIKSINGNSLIGSGDVTITSAVAWGNITGSNIMLQTDLRDSFEHRIAAGTTGQYWRGDKTWQTLNKAAVGLSAVDNTPDVDKPISNATNAALAGKQAQLVSGTNIKTINFIDLLGSGNITISGGSGGGETIDQTLALGNVTDTSIVQEDIDDITREIKPSNFNTSYGTAGVAKGFIEGVKSFAGVNSPDSRPNVVYSFGYNADIGGGRINTNEAAFRFGYETNYNINSDTARRGFEFHLPEVTTKEGNVLRLWSMYVNKSGGYTELSSQMENLYFTKVSNGASWLTLTNSNISNVIHQYGNDSATVIYTAMTNPDTQAGRIITSYSPTGSDTYEYGIKADSPTGKLFTTNMSTRFDNSLLSTSFMNINNTSSTGTPSQPTLRLDHANSGTTKVQDWYYNASLVAEVDKDYSLMAYKPVLLYYGGLVYGDITFNYSFGGVLKMVSLPVYDSEAAAVTGGLATNTVYKTTTGELRIKL